MNILVLDFETFFDSDYTLSKLTTEAYIRDPRFEAHGVGLWTPTSSSSAIWCAEPEAGPDGWAAAYDWANTTVLCHHAAFDGLILSHHYGVKPARWLDTMSMARYLFPGSSASLEALAKRFGLEPKTVPYDLIKGKRYRDLDRGTARALADGCLHDCELTWAIFNRMMKGDY